MSQRLTRSRKRQIEENIENFGIAVDDYGCTIDDFSTNKSPIKTKNRKNENDEDGWEYSKVMEVKRLKRDDSPDTSPIYFRKIMTVASVHPEKVKEEPVVDQPTLMLKEENTESILLEESKENLEPTIKNDPDLDNDDDVESIASDNTDKVAEDLMDLLEKTKDEAVLPHESILLDPNRIDTIELLYEKLPTEITSVKDMPSQSITEILPEFGTTNSKLIEESSMSEKKPAAQFEFDKIDLLSSESILIEN
uniref:CSON004421 protein n=1 Tax=Culicoides sonorensis TaxID=179676 RepID=A0A336L4Y7_CULSO